MVPVADPASSAQGGAIYGRSSRVQLHNATIEDNNAVRPFLGANDTTAQPRQYQ